MKKDLTNIKNFNFIFLEKILSQSILDQINDNLAFVHLNTGDFKVEFQYFDKIINKCLKNAILIVDNYGFLKKDDQTMYDEYLKANQKLYSYVSPSLQLVVMVK